MCFDRFSRLGPYGNGLVGRIGGIKTTTESFGSEKVLGQTEYVNYSLIDWGTAQKLCFEKNEKRFDEHANSGKKRVERHAYVLRAWNDHRYTEHQILTLRAMISELALKSGGEYDVHFLVHVRNNSSPIWADSSVYDDVLRQSLPQEFWNMTTLWSESLMKMYYPGPFTDNFANLVESNIHGAYRSQHFALQWFSQKHPEYDFFWNWELDVRFTGHYYELNSKVGEWARLQPRKGLWERNAKFWIPELHDSYDNFTELVERENLLDSNSQSIGSAPIWGPAQDFENSGMLPPPNETRPITSYEADNHEWGVGEDGDLVVFNPIFDPSTTNWVFSADITGYDRSFPIPPRRAAIITVARFSRRLLNIMHEEVWRLRHTMFPEMWPATVCLHHGLKAVYVPHPVYFDHDWNLENMNEVFNYPTTKQASPFGWGEHNLLGSSFYYNSAFAAKLWRRWLGQREGNDGGRLEEEAGTGRMCLPPMLLHPIKHEASPVE